MNFDDFYSKYYNLDGYEHHYQEFYEAGAASRQEEVDELHSEVDELQKRIYEALSELDLAYPECWSSCVDTAIKILKGEENENSN